MSAQSGEEQSRGLETQPVKGLAASCARPPQFRVFISTLRDVVLRVVQSGFTRRPAPKAASQSLYVTARAHTWIVSKEKITNQWSGGGWHENEVALMG